MLWYGFHHTIRNTGQTNSQITALSGLNIPTDITTNANAGSASYFSIDTTAAQNFTFLCRLTTSGIDWCFNLGGTITANYSGTT